MLQGMFYNYATYSYLILEMVIMVCKIQMLTLILKTLWGGWISFHSNHVLNGTQIGPWKLLAFKSVFNNES
jgi:hypothetical protein